MSTTLQAKNTREIAFYAGEEKGYCPMTAMGQLPDGTLVFLRGCTSSELEREADRVGCIAYRFPIDGGVEKLRKIAREWVIQ